MATSTLNGVLIIDKPPGITSHTVVSRVKRILGVRKAGHTGTLDPFATGVLPVCLNEGTKLSPFLMEQDKEYEGVILLGVETDTLDSTGNVVRQQEPGDVDVRAIESIFKSFEGAISQTPPMFSAIKQNGVPLYKLARKGVELVRKARTVTIHSLEVLKIELPRISFRVACSKGTYVRALAGDIGTELGCGGSLEALRRTRSGQFSLEKTICLDDLKELWEDDSIAQWLFSPAQALDSLPAIVVNALIADKVRHGMPVGVEELDNEYPFLSEPETKLRILSPKDRLLAVAETVSREKDSEKKLSTGPAWKLLRVFNLS